MHNSTYLNAIASLGVNGAHPGGLELTSALLASEPIRPGMMVLDAGCGTGETAAFLAKAYHCKVTAVDLHPLMLQKAALRFARDHLSVRLLHGNVEQLPFRSHSFDLVLSESVTVFTNVSRSLGEYRRVLKPGGVLLATEVASTRYIQPAQEKELKSFYGFSQIPTQEEWALLLHAAGFYSVKTVHQGSLPTLPQNNMFNPQDTLAKHMKIMEQYRPLLSYCCFRAR